MSTYNILSFCGGGERGLMSVIMLKRLQGNNPGLLQNTKMLTGCSTGAVIASFLALYKKYQPFDSEQDVEKALDALIKLYKFDMPLMFTNSKRSEKDPAAQPEVQQPNMEVFLIKLKDMICPHLSESDFLSLEMFDIKSSFDLMFPAFNIQKTSQVQPGNSYGGVYNESWGMDLFNNYYNSSTGSVPIIEAVAASSAMPGMSATVKVHTSGERKDVLGYYVDGAFVNHDPTMAAVSLAVSQGYKLEDISVICFGTGFMRNYIDDPEATQWGTRQWLNTNGDHKYGASKIPPLFVNDTQESPVLNMCLNGTSTNEIPTQSSLLLGQRYAYLNPDLGSINLPEDSHKDWQINQMIQFAGDVNLKSASSVVKHYWRQRHDV